jgi:hypothetical protein
MSRLSLLLQGKPGLSELAARLARGRHRRPEVAEINGQGIQVESVESYLPTLEDLAPRRRAHYLKRKDLHELVWTAPVWSVVSNPR